MKRERTTTVTRVGLAALLVGLGLAAVRCANGRRQPDVVLISIDCLNQRQLEESLTLDRVPHLARLAQDSLVFSRGYAHAPWTTPSHMSMLSGLYPSQHGRDIPYGLMFHFRDGDDRVPAYRTLPERLAAAGYEPVAFVGSGSISAVFGLGQGFSAYNEADRNNAEGSDLPLNLSRLKKWMDTPRRKPFFLFLHTYELHQPLSPAHSPFRRAVGYLDDRLGDVLSLLRERGLYDSSLIIVTGDHGSRMIRTEAKCCVHGAGHYEENLHVPFLMKLPAPGATGARDLLVRHVDILPTVLDVAGVPAESYDGPGSSILKRMETRASAEGVVSFSEADGRCRSRRAVVDGSFKYIYTPDRAVDRVLLQSSLFVDGVCSRHPACLDVPREELYDLEADPFEEVNLLKGPLGRKETAALEHLRGQMTAHSNLAPAYRHRLTVGPPRDRIDASTTEALRALGYIQ